MKLNGAISFFVISLLLVILSISIISENTSATDGSTMFVWDGEGADNLASTAENWYKNDAGTITNNVVPTNDSALIWNATSTKACTFDLDNSAFYAYSWTISSGYTGTITQGSTTNIEIKEGGYTQSNGIFSGSSSRVVNCSGDWIKSLGTITNWKLCLHMSGDGKILSLNSATTLVKLTISGNITTAGSGAVGITRDGTNWARLNVTGSLTIGPSGVLLARTNAADSYSNIGTIQGPGTLTFNHYLDITLNLGNVTSSIKHQLPADASASRIVTSTGDVNTLGSFTVVSNHASHTMTVDSAGRTLNASTITIGTRGIILGGEGDITTKSWDSSAGTWTPETSNVEFTGTGTVKTAAGQTFYNITVGAAASITQTSNVVVSEWMELDGGAWTKGAYTLTAPLMTITSSITATGSEDSAYSYTPTTDQPISSMSVVTNGTWLSIVGTSVVGTPTNTEVGTFYVNVTCTNVIGSVSQNSTITISNVAPVWLTADYSTEWSYGMTYSYDPTASDEGAGLTYSMTSSAIELRCDPVSGAIRGKVIDNSITVSLMADDGHGGVIWQNWTITAMGFSWDGDVMVNYTEGQNLKVTFNASLTNATYNSIIKSVQWNFGDGNGSRVLDLMPMHPYARAGTYMVTCYIVTEDDMTATKNFQITVGDPAVVEDLEAQYAERMNQAVLISGLACAAGLVLIACYIKIAGRRGWINRLVPVMILVAMLAISATLIGSAMQ